MYGDQKNIPRLSDCQLIGNACACHLGRGPLKRLSFLPEPPRPDWGSSKRFQKGSVCSEGLGRREGDQTLVCLFQTSEAGRRTVGAVS